MRKSLREILAGSSASDVVNELEAILREVAEELRPVSIIVCGSLAKGKFVRGLSDIDILVVVPRDVPKDRRFALRVAKDIDVEITVVSVTELKNALEKGNQFYRDAIESGVEVYGDLSKWLSIEGESEGRYRARAP